MYHNFPPRPAFAISTRSASTSTGSFTRSKMKSARHVSSSAVTSSTRKALSQRLGSPPPFTSPLTAPSVRDFSSLWLPSFNGWRSFNQQASSTLLKWRQPNLCCSLIPATCLREMTLSIMMCNTGVFITPLHITLTRPLICPMTFITQQKAPLQKWC